MPRLAAALTGLVSILTVAATACAASVPPTAAPTRPAPAASPAATALAVASQAGPANRKEVEYVRSPRRHLVALVDALKKNDPTAARSAIESYDAAWNGVEVYVNVRSRELYNGIEVQGQQQIEKLLETPQPNAAEILPIAEDMLAKYDQAIELSEAGPPLSPLFDDVTALRVARAELRKVGPALRANNPAEARTAYEAFEGRWRDVQELIKLRSPGAHREIEDANKKAGGAVRAAQPNPTEAGPLVDALIERYNYGLSLVNAAARGADLARIAHTPDDIRAGATLGRMEAELRTSLPLWEAGRYPAAGEHASRAANELFDAAAAPLKAKSADVNLKKALDAYLAMADRAGDQARARAANRAAVEAVAVAQQSLIGQFWAEPKLHGAVLTALLIALQDEVGKAAGQSSDRQAIAFQSAWGTLQVADVEYRRVEGQLKTSAPEQVDAASKALGTLKSAFPDPLDPTATPPTPDAVARAADAAAAALKTGLGLQ
ncbi:MAG TPA: hypothetical protein VGM69_12940 [Chloroflexota bacterium]